MNQDKQIIGYNQNTGEPIYDNVGQNNSFNDVKTNSYASIGKRVAAFMIDSILSILFISILTYIFVVISGIIASLNQVRIDSTVISILLFLSIMSMFYGQPLYCVIAESGKKHATIGKRLMHIVVKNGDGSYLTFSQSLIRNILKLISFFIPFVEIVSLILIATSDKKQAIHDMIMNQIVISEK